MKRTPFTTPFFAPPIRDPSEFALFQFVEARSGGPARGLSRAECKQVLSLRGRRPWQPASVGWLNRGAFSRGHAASIRSAATVDIPFTASTSWLYERILSAVSVFNARWRFDLAGILRPIKLVRYRAGDHYAWHVDAGPGELSDRKISVTVQLSAPTAYQGGSLELFGGIAPQATPRLQGTVVAFPSHLLHRITPVEEGERFALVAWVQGPPFR
jgi:PKHD-type hydroxylase